VSPVSDPNNLPLPFSTSGGLRWFPVHWSGQTSYSFLKPRFNFLPFVASRFRSMRLRSSCDLKGSELKNCLFPGRDCEELFKFGLFSRQAFHLFFFLQAFSFFSGFFLFYQGIRFNLTVRWNCIFLLGKTINGLVLSLIIEKCRPVKASHLFSCFPI